MSGPEIDWSEVRSWFPALERWAYLNAASMSPLPVPVHEAMCRFLDRCRDDDVTGEVHLEHAGGLRRRAASFLGCSPEDLALTSSTSEGILRAAEAPDWRPGDNVVVPHGSFPAAVLPLLPLAERGVEVRLAGSPETGWIAEEEIVRAVDDRTRLVCVSWVSFSTGHRYDLRLLGEACRDRGALLCVDLMQGAGALAPELDTLPVDMAATQPVKWVPAPSGLGLFYCTPEVRSRAAIRHRGWTSARWESLDDLTDYGRPLWGGARRYESGSVPPLLVAGFEAALDLMARVGQERITRRVYALADRLRKGLLERGYSVLTPDARERRAGITTFRSSKPGPVVASLRASGVVVCARQGGVRVSTHFYNDENDVDRLLKALPPPDGQS